MVNAYAVQILQETTASPAATTIFCLLTVRSIVNPILHARVMGDALKTEHALAWVALGGQHALSVHSDSMVTVFVSVAVKLTATAMASAAMGRACATVLIIFKGLTAALASWISTERLVT